MNPASAIRNPTSVAVAQHRRPQRRDARNLPHDVRPPRLDLLELAEQRILLRMMGGVQVKYPSLHPGYVQKPSTEIHKKA